ncbi:MAG: PBP1A family penicillin-binding protein [Bacillota bacterium]|nr:PBP1A family penicillin-binding protein [Bacillota bacterium]
MAEKKVPIEQKNIKTKNKKTSKRRSILKITLLVLLLLFLAGGAVTAKIVSDYVNEAPPFDPSKLETVETSYLYDSNGEEVTALHEEQNRIAVSLDEIPMHVQNAFIAIEDERFDKHFGFDIIGSIRAAYTNLRAGGIVQGASTISQQLAQNAFLTTETSYKRKIQEIWLSIQLERNFTKDEILELYLNRVYFGNGAYGVEAAAQTYFGKSINELNLAEGAMIAGAVRSPNFYNPIDNEPEAIGRMRLVLSNMLRLEMISEAEYEQAINRQMIYSEPPSLDYPYPHYVDYVVHHELIRILSAIPEIGSRSEAYRAIYTGGLRVYTALDPEMQLHVEDVLSREDLYPSTAYYDMPLVREAVAEIPANRDLTRAQLQELVIEEGGVAQPQGAIVLADPTNGKLLALGGGRDYLKNVNEVLRFNTLRQPGSAIKPIITYAPAFEEGVLAGAGSTLDDSPYINPRGNWFPENFDFRFRGMITARQALYFSYNIPAIRAFEALGPRVGAGYAQRMGISTLHPDEVDNLSLTLGGLTYGVSAIDMAQAYSVLANNGVKIDLHAVEKIVDREGNILYEYISDPRQIISPQSAFLVSDILQDFVTKYLGRALQIDRPVAAKTGTTENWKDVYLVAYTPNIVASFWMGYDEPKMGSIQQGWRYSTAFLREVFLEVFEDLEVTEFERPDGIVSVSVCNKSGLRPNEWCQAVGTVISDYFIEGQVPVGTCDMHLGGFYNRPPYIITDDRWSSRGGLGRGPEDALEMQPGSPFGDMGEQPGSTTTEFSFFRAYVVADGVTLQWQYNGPEVRAFELRRSAHGLSDDGFAVELDSNTRQYSDTATEANTFYTYTVAAIMPDGSVSDPATVTVSTMVEPAGGILPQQPTEGSLVIVPDVVGSFQAIAEMRLSRAGLRVGMVSEQFSDSVPRGHVMRQVPEAGSTLVRGSEVGLIISRGVESRQ